MNSLSLINEPKQHLIFLCHTIMWNEVLQRQSLAYHSLELYLKPRRACPNVTVTPKPAKTYLHNKVVVDQDDSP